MLRGAGRQKYVRQLVEGAISARWPATILQIHPRSSLLDRQQSDCELADFYREVWAKHQRNSPYSRPFLVHIETARLIGDMSFLDEPQGPSRAMIV